MNRRQLLLGAVALFTLRAGELRASPQEASGDDIPLWPMAPPGGGGPMGGPVLTPRGALMGIARPCVRVFRPLRANGRAVLIAAGGGYRRIEMRQEAWPAAAWLTARGYTAYVLSYRLPNEGWHDGNRVALQDAQRALRLLRTRERRLGVLGFSAGGHLLGLAAALGDVAAYPPQDAFDDIPIRADFAALIYPIITLQAPYTHTSTHNVLLGPHATKAEEARWSVQNFVSPHSPPFFMAQAKDDAIANPENTLIMASACERAHVPVELHRFTRGGHGFGMGRAGTPTLAWPGYYQDWLDRYA
ncbi:alpha/beta hydrolase [Martelella alba]|uniref:Alpha/beta hydrolase n=1 Tax=Martelella alba TaxID=2590451 RepID=A0ABY2SQM5_9HYPH|nr:alpha/beta hydrolase [Martelella alba]TKI07788.1 alpha/beta hydrolase [Martelella alba]